MKSDLLGNRILDVPPAGYKSIPSLNSFGKNKAVVSGYTIRFDNKVCSGKKYLCATVDGYPDLLIDSAKVLGYKDAVVISTDTIRLAEFNA